MLADVAELDLAQPRWRMHSPTSHPRCAHAAAALPLGASMLLELSILCCKDSTV